VSGRLKACDLELVGRYLFGPRWQTALARALRRDPRLVRYWVASQRQVPRFAREQIERLLTEKHEQRMQRANAAFLHMIAGLSDVGVKERLLGVRLVGFQVDNQLRRAGLGLTPPPVVKPPLDFTPHNMTACECRPVYHAQVAKKSLKSAPVAPTVINGARTLAVVSSAEPGASPGSLSRSVLSPSSAAPVASSPR
jgi:hypothetical protein